MNLIKYFMEWLFCKHEWEGHGFNYAKCKHCGKTKYDPELASEAINNRCDKMIKAGLWKEEDVIEKQIKYAIKYNQH